MDNLVDVRRKNNLNFILPVEVDLYQKNYDKSEIGIFLYLYYDDTIDFYINYIESAIKVADVYIATSKSDVYNLLNNLFPSARVCMKNNRGRDISSLLVTFAPYILNYKYIAFLHDKKAHGKIYEKDTREWIEDMWENLLASEIYINNVIGTFENNKDIGMLVSPELFGEYSGLFYHENWGQNYNNTVELANKLGITADIDYKKGPMMLGTAFWCRSEVLVKLYQKDWKYEDFPNEPLADDGTISHAIERLFAYLSQDKGLSVGNVMTVYNAGKIKEKSQILLKESFKVLGNLGIYNAAQLANSDKNKQKIMEFFREHSAVYLYGAGKIGKCYLKLLYMYDCIPAGFAVSSLNKNPSDINGIKVYQLDQIDFSENNGFIISVAKKMQAEVMAELNKRHITQFIALI